MTTELLEIQPRVIKFTFELKKPSSCSIMLINKTEQYVAFKVKTTSPKKYCVQPNGGIIKPKSSCDFTVIMQAQKVAPPEMQCKDKFLVQSTIVPFGTSEEEVASDLFSKESGKYIEEKKIRVLLIGPIQSPALLPNNGEQKQDPRLETWLPRDIVSSGVDSIPPPHTVFEDMEGLDEEKVSPGNLKQANEMESRLDEEKVSMGHLKETTEMGARLDEEKVSSLGHLKETNEIESRLDEEKISLGHLKETSEMESRSLCYEDEQNTYQDWQSLNLVDSEELRLKLRVMDLKLREAELTIEKLTEERRAMRRENDKLKRDLELLRKSSTKKVQVGFPLLYVLTVALISMFIGYLACI